MRLDHVSYAAGHEQVVDVVERLGAALGGALVDGGRHPRFGTCNFVLPLAGSCYLEVVSAFDHPSVDAAPFGQAVRRRAAAGGGWLGWVVAVDDLAPVERRLGRPAVAGNRRRPDGHELRWRQLGVLGLLADPSLPFFVQWLGPASDHPSTGARTDLRIERLEVSGDRATVRNWLGRPVRGLLPEVALDWVDAAEPGLVAVHFATPRGTVRID
jgi:Glyoxalase-like domain